MKLVTKLKTKVNPYCIERDVYEDELRSGTNDIKIIINRMTEEELENKKLEEKYNRDLLNKSRVGYIDQNSNVFLKNELIDIRNKSRSKVISDEDINKSVVEHSSRVSSLRLNKLKDETYISKFNSRKVFDSDVIKSKLNALKNKELVI
jgi:hypothetical protein